MPTAENGRPVTTTSFVATDVGVWMALPAFLPALIVVGVVVFIARRDRASDDDDPPPEPHQSHPGSGAGA